MLGIVFTGGKGPEPQRIRSLVKESAGDILMAAADSGLDAMKNAGLKPDWVIGDMDSISDPECLTAYPEHRVLRYPTDKDHTDTELAFFLLKKKGCGDIWIIGGGGGRVDHLFGIRSLLERDSCPVRWFLDNADIFCIDAGNNAALNLSIEKNALVSVFPLVDGPWKATSRGLKWALDNLEWNRGFFGLSNETPDGKFSIYAQQGRFMVIVPQTTHESGSKLPVSKE